MTAVAYKSSIVSSYYKMDNVLYEIRDAKGIAVNIKYDAWKVEVLRDLLQAGFINIQNDLYTISEEGREVIQQDSFLYYNKRLKLKKNEKSEAELEEKTRSNSNIVLILIAGSIIAVMLLYFLMKSGITF